MTGISDDEVLLSITASNRHVPRDWAGQLRSMLLAVQKQEDDLGFCLTWALSEATIAHATTLGSAMVEMGMGEHHTVGSLEIALVQGGDFGKRLRLTLVTNGRIPDPWLVPELPARSEYRKLSGYITTVAALSEGDWTDQRTETGTTITAYPSVLEFDRRI